MGQGQGENANCDTDGAAAGQQRQEQVSAPPRRGIDWEHPAVLIPHHCCFGFSAFSSREPMPLIFHVVFLENLKFHRRIYINNTLSYFIITQIHNALLVFFFLS